MQETKKGAIQLLKTREDTAEMLDLINETFHQMPFTIQPSVVLTQDVCALVRRDNRLNTAIQQVLDKMLSRIAPIRDQAFKIKAFQQRIRLGNIMPLSTTEGEAQRITQPVNGDMDFATEATATAP